MENKKKTNMSFVTLLIVVGITSAYAMQQSPSSILLNLKDYFQIFNNDLLLNMSVSIMYPFIVFACIVGGSLESKIGTRKMYTLTLALIAVGAFGNFIAKSYTVFLICRAIYGLGFGFGVPFIGSAIMKWYDLNQREKMNTLNGLFPFIGTLIGFLFVPLMYNWFNQSWAWALGIFGFPVVIVLVLWIAFVKEDNLPNYVTQEDETIQEEGIYRNLLKRREMKLLIVTFVCDFMCYSYVAVILPTLIFEASTMSEAQAGLWAAVAFPAVGIVGASVGGTILAKTGLRKPSLVLAQFIKFFGILIMSLGANTSVVFVLVGVAIFGFGNSLWMPAMYCVPMDLKDMNATRAGAAFGLLTACGMVSGFVSPTIGGYMTNALMNISGIADPIANHVFGLSWSLFVFGFLNLVGAICMIKLPETGTRKSEQLIDAETSSSVQ